MRAFGTFGAFGTPMASPLRVIAFGWEEWTINIQKQAMVAGSWTFVAVMAGWSPSVAAGPQIPKSGIVLTQRVEIPVTLSDAQEYTVIGYLSTKLGGGCGLLKPRTLQVLLHGGTYDHEYWDAPKIDGVRYSYARYMTERCYSVLSLDMLGTGESSVPPGDRVGVEESSAAVEQVLAELREAGGPCLHPFEKIALVGHSRGTITSVYTLGTYGAVADALVATGWAHVPHIIPVDLAVFEEPLSHPYVAFAPEVRAPLFYHAPTADPDVIAYDNAHMANALPRALMLDVLDLMIDLAIGDPTQIKAASLVDKVDVPVLVQLGQYDLIAPSSVAGQEASYYSSSPSVTVQTLADIGHDYNLHLNHEAGWEQIDAWLTATLGK